MGDEESGTSITGTDSGVTVDKDTVKEALQEILTDIPAFWTLSAGSDPMEGASTSTRAREGGHHAWSLEGREAGLSHLAGSGHDGQRK